MLGMVPVKKGANTAMVKLAVAPLASDAAVHVATPALGVPRPVPDDTNVALVGSVSSTATSVTVSV